MVFIHRQKHLGFNLAEAFHNAADAKIGRATRPYRPHTGASQKGSDGLGKVWKQGRYPVTLLNSHTSQTRCRCRRLPVKLRKGYCGEATILSSTENGRMVVPAAQACSA